MKQATGHRSIYDIPRTSPYEGPYRRPPSSHWWVILTIILIALTGLLGLSK